MPIERPDNPAYDEADRAAVRRRNVELLTRMNQAAADWGLDLLQPPKPADPVAAEQTAATFDRIFRGVRRAILLIDKLIEPTPAAPADPPPRRAPPQERPPRARKPNAEERAHRDRMDSLDRLDSISDAELNTWPDDDLRRAACHAMQISHLDDSGTPRPFDQVKAIYFLRVAWNKRECLRLGIPYTDTS